jgi:hypothetical protein
MKTASAASVAPLGQTGAATTATQPLPLGPLPGGLVVSELHMDGKTEGKQFAPDYGEFFTADGPDVEALALSAAPDHATGPEPAELRTMDESAAAVFV